MTRDDTQSPAIVITLADPVPFGHVSSHDLLLCAALGARSGTQDPVDLALLSAAARTEDLRHYQQLEYAPPDAEFQRSITRVRHLDSGHEQVIARGDIDSILYLCRIEEGGRYRAGVQAGIKEVHGFRSVGVALGEGAGADGKETWQYLGFIPVKAFMPKERRTRRRDEPDAYRYVPVWDWQLRVLHWTAAIAILVLAMTGWLIGSSRLTYLMPGGDPFYIGYLRLIHFTVGWLLLATALLRIAGLFIASTKFQRWQALFPISMTDLRNLFKVMKNYLFCIFEHGPHYIGHNPLQQVAYTGIYLIGGVAVLTGFSLYAMYDTSNVFFWPVLWLNHLIGPQYVRLIHLFTMWIFLAFIPIHVYLAIRSDTVEREGAISSIFSGGRWCRKGTKFEDD
jgi:Ni/Fe-hydrogenase b-type cytochrome subunit